MECQVGSLKRVCLGTRLVYVLNPGFRPRHTHVHLHKDPFYQMKSDETPLNIRKYWYLAV